MEITESLSGVIAVTRSRRNPAHAGGGLVTDSPALPLPGCSSSSPERGLPAGAQGRDPERSEQLLARVPGEVEQRVRFGDRHLFGTGGHLDDFVSGLYLALVQHTEVEARAVV